MKEVDNPKVYSTDFLIYWRSMKCKVKWSVVERSSDSVDNSGAEILGRIITQFVLWAASTGGTDRVQ